MTIIAHSKRLIALDVNDEQDITAIDLRLPERALASARRQRDGIPRAEIAARLAQAGAFATKDCSNVHAAGTEARPTFAGVRREIRMCALT
jgi:hypothetical protein